jgi:RNA polymerase sigma-70 factor, ECF subfamily
MTQLNDRELMAAASQGQVAAFASLIGRYRDVRTRFALRMLGDYDMADEAIQASYLRAFQTISRCRESEQFEDWLFRIVINECRARALRRAVRSRRVTGEVDAIADWRAAVEGTENGADVQRALDQIDPINREAFILQYIEELTYPQIAALTGASVVTLERQVDRAC